MLLSFRASLVGRRLVASAAISFPRDGDNASRRRRLRVGHVRFKLAFVSGDASQRNLSYLWLAAWRGFNVSFVAPGSRLAAAAAAAAELSRWK